MATIILNTTRTTEVSGNLTSHPNMDLAESSLLACEDEGLSPMNEEVMALRREINKLKCQEEEERRHFLLEIDRIQQLNKKESLIGSHS